MRAPSSIEYHSTCVCSECTPEYLDESSLENSTKQRRQKRRELDRLERELYEPLLLDLFESGSSDRSDQGEHSEQSVHSLESAESSPPADCSDSTSADPQRTEATETRESSDAQTQRNSPAVLAPVATLKLGANENTNGESAATCPTGRRRRVFQSCSLCPNPLVCIRILHLRSAYTTNSLCYFSLFLHLL